MKTKLKGWKMGNNRGTRARASSIAPILGHPAPLAMLAYVKGLETLARDLGAHVSKAAKG